MNHTYKSYGYNDNSAVSLSKRSDLSGLFSYLHKSNAFLDLIRDGLE
ncbi:hypothetical protein VV99796_03370 [Vibrio vulnificus]|nr:hypothetical protein VV99796_03370 [Vibrio vulnificus]OJI44475.1 hypothetical protein VVS316_03551 [Vibrio vulnificus]